jgi:D-beta-D-heptose 7-phosphate kinase/D-beta-D-heptose 1-phosphate adenosyltransferase
MTAPHDDWMHKVDALSGVRVLCVGDAMLDRFVYGAVARLSPEAPIPVLTQERVEEMVGGAGNVAANLKVLGARPEFLSVIGGDAAGEQLRGMCEGEFIPEAERPTTVKTRYICGQQQMLRVDSETVRAIAPATQAALIARIKARLKDAQALLLSDYAKGVLTPEVLRAAIDAARERGIPVIVDPKRKDFMAYGGATVVTPNLAELAEATLLPVAGDDAIAAASMELMAVNHFDAVLTTRGAKGMTLVERDGTVTHAAGRHHRRLPRRRAGGRAAAGRRHASGQPRGGHRGGQARHRAGARGGPQGRAADAGIDFRHA